MHSINKKLVFLLIIIIPNFCFAFSKLSEFVFSNNEKHKTNSLLIYKDGKIVFEKYANDFHAQSPQALWSISKTITGLLIGILEKDNKLKASDFAAKYLENIPKDITIEHLLQMSPGLKWTEDYDPRKGLSDVIQMLYLGIEDMAEFAINQKQIHPSGTYFNYSSGTSNILTKIIHNILEENEYRTFPWDRLFTPLEITTATFEKDQSGNFIGSSGVFMSARDLLKIGILALNDGSYKGKQILDSSWMERSKKLASSFKTQTYSNQNSYGYQWWLNKKLKTQNGRRAYEQAPETMFFSQGFQGQLMYIIPSKNTIAIRLGMDKKQVIDKQKFMSLLLEELK